MPKEMRLAADVRHVSRPQACLASVTVGLLLFVGDASATSGLPVNTGPPVISGTAQVGQTLTASVGAWTGASGFNIEWRQCNVAVTNCQTIPGATGPHTKFGSATNR